MNPHGDDQTPTKSVSRVSLSPKTKESICILCAESVLNSSFRRDSLAGAYPVFRSMKTDLFLMA